MLRPYDTENDKRLRTIVWIKAHINELNDTDKVLLLNAENETSAMKIYNACPTEEELDKEDKLELQAAKNAFDHVNV